MTDFCKYSARCWRFLYSKYFLKKPYDIPPTRLNLILEGYGTLSLLPNKGLFCVNMPSKGREDLLCPYLVNGHQMGCFEYERQEKQDEKNKDKPKFIRFPNKQVRTPIPREWRILIARKYKYYCVYCGRHLGDRDEIGKKVRVVIDHFVPLALGGSNTIDNLVCSCFDCNTDKGANLWELGCRKDFYPKYNKGDVWNLTTQ